MPRKRQIVGVKGIADYLNISVRAFWYQHKIKPFPTWRLRPKGKIRAYVSDLDKYVEERSKDKKNKE